MGREVARMASSTKFTGPVERHLAGELQGAVLSTRLLSFAFYRCFPSPGERAGPSHAPPFHAGSQAVVGGIDSPALWLSRPECQRSPEQRLA